jgi:Flp pilus assembly protein TadG
MPTGKKNGAPGRKGFLARLARDAAGNTLAIVAAALIPLTAMIGSGIDMSRAYMAKTRLQSACDAAALAGRRVMADDAIDDNVRDTATQFLNFNFPQRLYGTAAFTPTITKPDSGTVRMQIATTIPTTVMHMFGFTSLPLNVTCDASLNFINTDVMLVLDVTGSMDWDINNNRTSDDSARKITALRDAVMALYDQLKPIQDQLEANGLRLRYGIVPYSSTVNVGYLIAGATADGGINHPEYLADNVAYQSRVANYTDPNYDSHDGPHTDLGNQSQTKSNRSDCQDWATQTSTTGTRPNPTTTTSYEQVSFTGGKHSSGTCTRHGETWTTTYELRNYGFANYTYQQSTYDVSRYKLGDSIRIASSSNGNTPTPGSYNMQAAVTSVSGVDTRSVSWNGCIEERSTVNTITSASGFNIPAAAYDLNINLIPNSDATRWRPMFPQIEYSRSTGTAPNDRGSSQSNASCPPQAVRLKAWTRDALQTYVDNLNPVGSTYHDIGMIWGARLISNGGVFADSPDTYNGMPVARHIIFMTDGQMDTDRSIYAFQGIEQNDQRISGQQSPSESDLNSRHTQRFRMICNAAKSLNVSIWVIAFGTSLTPEMTECASSASQASTITDRDALIARFRQIGSNIGALRLTQ